jgi:hypothetical protein
MFGCNAWHAPGNVTKFRSAMLALHSPYIDLRGEYSPICTECVRNNDEFQKDPTTRKGLYGSCSCHPCAPLLLSKDNPVKSMEVISHIRRIKDAANKVNGNVIIGGISYHSCKVDIIIHSCDHDVRETLS